MCEACGDHMPFYLFYCTGDCSMRICQYCAEMDWPLPPTWIEDQDTDVVADGSNVEADQQGMDKSWRSTNQWTGDTPEIREESGSKTSPESSGQRANVDSAEEAGLEEVQKMRRSEKRIRAARGWNEMLALAHGMDSGVVLLSND